MKTIEDIICIAHTDKYAIYEDQYGEIKVIEDEENIIEPGDLCIDDSQLVSIEDLNKKEQEKINYILQEE